MEEKLLKNLPYFNKSTLEDILGKKGENLNYWIKKLLAQGDLVGLKKGLYVSKLYVLSLEKNPALDEGYREYLANILRYPSYLSLEYCLAKYGLIPEAIYSFTSVTTKSSRTYKNKLGNFIYRSLKKELFFGFNYQEFEDKKIRMATKVKALFDLFYFKKFANQRILKQELLKDLRINWEVLSSKDKKMFSKIVAQANSRKMKLVLNILKKEGIIP